MTDKVYISFGGVYRSREGSVANRFSGIAGGDGWVQPSSSRLVEDSEGDLATGALNAFAESSSSSSFDVTIDTGEAIVRGVYLARDTTTTITLDSSENNQLIEVGWKDGQENTVLIGERGGVGDSFTSNDPSIPIFEFDTDGSGVTTVRDKRLRGGPDYYEGIIEWAAANANIPNGDAQVMGFRDVPNNHRVEIAESVLVQVDAGTAVSSGVDLVIAEDASNTSASITTVLSGDGSTLFLDENLDTNNSFPVVYENTTNSTQTIGIVIDNGHYNNASGGSGSTESAYGYVNGRVVA